MQPDQVFDDSQFDVRRGEGRRQVGDRLDTSRTDHAAAGVIPGGVVHKLEIRPVQLVAKNRRPADGVDPAGFDGNDAPRRAEKA